MKKRIYLIDGSGFIFRAYYSLPSLTRSDKTPIGAVLGFCNMLVKLLKEMDAHSLAVVFDAQRKNFRHDIYPEYKANRLETPADLIPQFPMIRDACHAFGVPSLECPGFEADDVIATYAHRAENQNMEVVIVSSDKDLMQLVKKDVTLYDPLKAIFITAKEVEEKFGVQPEQVLDVLALAGDSSDNIPGVPGIGPKTAAQLIQQFKTLDNLLTNIDQLPPSKRKEILENNRDQALLSKQLVALDYGVPLSTPLDELHPKTDPTVLKNFLQKNEFKALEKRLYPAAVMDSSKVLNSYETIKTIDQLKRWIEKLSKCPIIGFDTETDSEKAIKAKLVGLSFSTNEAEACYIPVKYEKQAASLFEKNDTEVLEVTTVLDHLKPLLTNTSVRKVGHYIKYDKLVLQKYGVEVYPYDDTILLSYLVQQGRHALDVLTEQHFQYKMTPFKELVSGTQNFSNVPLDRALKYACEDADYTLRLYHLFFSSLTDPLKKLYQEIDLPLVNVLMRMEKCGIKIDATQLKVLTGTFQNTINLLSHDIFDLAKEEFNIGSPKQLGEVLFEKLKLPVGKKSKTGFSTDSSTLENLAIVHPIAEKILQWRQISKLKSTYTETLIEVMDPLTQRIHTSYGMTTTSTGRLSSSDPNLQNIPVRTEEGKKIRRCFVAEKGNCFLSFDYSQIELRLLAHFASIPTLEKAFHDNVDIHTLTASQVFNVSLNDVTPSLRSKAKAINFGIIYGISPFGLAQQLKISPKEASQYIGLYHKQYPGIQEYMDRIIDFAKDHGYVETLWGRRCYIPNIQEKNSNLRSFAERQAINAPLQGTNADLIKKAMIQIDQWLSINSIKTKMLLQVHDELVFECPVEEVEKVIHPIQSIMISVDRLKVPLLVEISKGDNWEDSHTIDQ